MIVLDTDITSVFVRPRQQWHPDVAAWLAALPRDQVYLTAITRAEIAYGVALMPPGRRAREYAARVAALLTDLEPVTLPFGTAAADLYARFVADRQRCGRTIGTHDAQIAAITSQHRADLATRNTKDFADLGLRLVNPYDRSTWR
ncbi:MAG: type II toxin-antitoxin system VapC family toxin [Micrococcales bacterium]|nr:type II toxin-antitoxin system VapC family toxin [Micrococcales bacterium]